MLDFVRDNYSGILRFNELKQRIELEGKFFDVDYAYFQIADDFGIDCGKNTAADAFTTVAKENAYNPVEIYLNAVASSVEPISIDNLATRYFGTSNPLYDAFLKRTLIAAVARTYEPGCKNDTALVLQGGQGIGKSTFFNVLGGDWFDDSMGAANNKDDLLILHKCWIQEWGEIERVFSKKQAGELKAFLSRRTDAFREPYARSTVEHPRRSIIVGSVNNAQFLVDSTGNRRYWVIPIEVDRINIELLKQERDCIWAAAVHAYRAGEVWWLTHEEESLSGENNEQFRVPDEWESYIATYIEGKARVSVSEILEKVFYLEPAKIDRPSQMRVGTILTILGWKNIGARQHQGRRQKVWEPIEPKQQARPHDLGTEVVPEVVTLRTLENKSFSRPHDLSPPLTQSFLDDKARGDTSDRYEVKSNLGAEVVSGSEVVITQSQQSFQPSTTEARPATRPQIDAKVVTVQEKRVGDLKAGDRVSAYVGRKLGTVARNQEGEDVFVRWDDGDETCEDILDIILIS